MLCKKKNSSSIHIIIKSESSHKCCASLSRLYNNISILDRVWFALCFFVCYFLASCYARLFFNFFTSPGLIESSKQRERESRAELYRLFRIFCVLLFDFYFILFFVFIWYGIAAIVDCSPMAQTNNRLGAFQSRAYIDSAADSPGSSYTPS